MTEDLRTTCPAQFDPSSEERNIRGIAPQSQIACLWSAPSSTFERALTLQGQIRQGVLIQ